jgi:dolichol-phosphate mannosyltransferase
MHIVIVVPTFNEADNVGRLINELETVFPTIPNHQMSLLIVDGNSPDGTAEKVRELSKTRPWIHVLVEKEKKGIGAAYFYGFEHAMHTMHADAVVEMDGDLQHDPKELPILIQPLDEGFDYVIGSRFVKGGSIPEKWSLWRKFLSFGGSLFSKLVLGMMNVNDFSTGYKAIRVKGFLDDIDFTTMRTKGFAYKTEMLYRIYKMGARIKEVPITFGLRDRGTSKMESANFWDSLKLVIGLRLNEKKEFVKFCIVGGMGFITDAGIFNILGLSLLPLKTAAIVSGTLAMLVTFLMNNFWSFGSRKMRDPVILAKKFPLYVAVSFVPVIFRGYLVSWTVAHFGRNFFIYNGAFVVGVGVGLVWNYLIYSKVFWKKS